MARRQLQALFEGETQLLSAIRDLRSSNVAVEDVYTPYAVHGLEDAIGLRPTRIGWVCAIFGLSGAAFALLFQEWTSVVSWSLNVGGKPYDSWPAFVPVVFEVGVACGGLSSVLALFYLAGLYPGKKAQLPSPRVTDDQFAVLLDASGADFDMARARDILQGHGAVAIDEVMATSPQEGSST